VRRILARLAPLFLALRDASTTDPEAAQVWSQIRERRAANMRLLAADLLATGQLREGLSTDEVADTIWVTYSPDLHRLLVEDRGWSPEHYQEWLATSWRRLFLAEG
jgi:hypothetical protein